MVTFRMGSRILKFHTETGTVPPPPPTPFLGGRGGHIQQSDLSIRRRLGRIMPFLLPTVSADGYYQHKNAGQSDTD
jgi:hypothetical protein